MAFTGVGSTMLGAFLPGLLVHWQIHDHQGGMLVASLFLGSFAGTLSISEHLDVACGEAPSPQRWAASVSHGPRISRMASCPACSRSRSWASAWAS